MQAGNRTPVLPPRMVLPQLPVRSRCRASAHTLGARKRACRWFGGCWRVVALRVCGDRVHGTLAGVSAPRSRLPNIPSTCRVLAADVDPWLVPAHAKTGVCAGFGMLHLCMQMPVQTRTQKRIHTCLYYDLSCKYDTILQAPPSRHASACAPCMLFRRLRRASRPLQRCACACAPCQRY